MPAAGDAARGATLWVTLEPCMHQGRTPPCTDAIIAAGVRRVVIAIVDPDRQVFGGGIEAWAAYVVALAFLLVRPSGLFGQKLVERV